MFKPIAHADAAPFAKPNRLRVERDDPRADNRRRVIDVAREAVIIHRTVARVTMTIHVPAIAYRGVALRLTGLLGGGVRCEVRLAHRDPDLCVLLAEGDDQAAIESALVRLSEQVQLVITTGGTGIAARDVTPEATCAVCSKLIDGVPERMRTQGEAQTPFAILSRGVCGVRGRSLILNLPGSPGGAVDSLRAVLHILPHAIDLLAGKTGHNDMTLNR